MVRLCLAALLALGFTGAGPEFVGPQAARAQVETPVPPPAPTPLPRPQRDCHEEPIA